MDKVVIDYKHYYDMKHEAHEAQGTVCVNPFEK